MGGFEPADDVFDKRKPGEQDVKYKRRLPSVLGCVVIAVSAGVLFFGIFAAVWVLVSPMLTDAGDTANAFMLALRDKEYQAAYDLGTADFQREVEHPENLIGLLKHPRDWKFNGFNLRNGAGDVRGSVEFDDGTSQFVRIFLLQESDGWKIAGISF